MTDKKSWPGKVPNSQEIGTALRDHAREMRNNPTFAERLLWSRLRSRRCAGFKFRRQHIIDSHIVDFYCMETKLVIEVDGDVHDLTFEQDQVRQKHLESLGLRVLRFTNNDVRYRLEGVLHTIEKTLTSHR